MLKKGRICYEGQSLCSGLLNDTDFPEGLLEALELFSKVGYDGVELIGNNTGGLPLDEFKQLLKDLNLKVISVHTIRGEKDAPFASAMGAKYVNVSLDPALLTREDILKGCAALNSEGKLYADMA